MKTEVLKAAIVLVCLFAAAPIVAKDKARVHQQTKAKRNPAPKVEAAASAPVREAKEPWVGIDVTIGAPERELIQGYVQTNIRSVKGKKAKGLPPGLAKKVARGGQLPPGWQKKCVRGEIMPQEVYKHCHPLPKELVIKLPPSPVGTILVTVHGKVVRLAKATREILDVFDVH